MVRYICQQSLRILGLGYRIKSKVQKIRRWRKRHLIFLKRHPETTGVELCGRGGHSCQIYCRTLSRPATNFACISYGFYNLNLCFIQGFFVSQNFTFCLIFLHSVKIWYILSQYFTSCRILSHLCNLHKFCPIFLLDFPAAPWYNIYIV